MRKDIHRDWWVNGEFRSIIHPAIHWEFHLRSERAQACPFFSLGVSQVYRGSGSTQWPECDHRVRHICTITFPRLHVFDPWFVFAFPLFPLRFFRSFVHANLISQWNCAFAHFWIWWLVEFSWIDRSFLRFQIARVARLVRLVVGPSVLVIADKTTSTFDPLKYARVNRWMVSL